MKLKERAKRLKTDIPAVFLAIKDKDTPVIAKIFGAVTVAYALSPIDLIPDFIPIMGYLDDLILLPVLAALTIKFIPKDVMEKSRALSAAASDFLKICSYCTSFLYFIAGISDLFDFQSF